MKRFLFLLIIFSASFVLLFAIHQNSRKNISNLFQRTNHPQTLGSAKANHLIRIAIVPHHLLAQKFIEDMIIKLKSQKPKTIILIGPNHFEKGNFPILTSSIVWNTPQGTLNPNLSIIKSLILLPTAHENKLVVSSEHSIRPIVNIIGKYINGISIVPIVLSNRLNTDEINNFVQFLESHLDTSTVVIISVDFSHYLKKYESEKKDAVMLSYIKRGNIEDILKLDNGYVDGRTSLATGVKIAKDIGLRLKMIQHGNSGDILNNPLSRTTSYYEIAFYD